MRETLPLIKSMMAVPLRQTMPRTVRVLGWFDADIAEYDEREAPEAFDVAQGGPEERRAGFASTRWLYGSHWAAVSEYRDVPALMDTTLNRFERPLDAMFYRIANQNAGHPMIRSIDPHPYPQNTRFKEIKNKDPERIEEEARDAMRELAADNLAVIGGRMHVRVIEPLVALKFATPQGTPTTIDLRLADIGRPSDGDLFYRFDELDGLRDFCRRQGLDVDRRIDELSARFTSRLDGCHVADTTRASMSRLLHEMVGEGLANGEIFRSLRARAHRGYSYLKGAIADEKLDDDVRIDWLLPHVRAMADGCPQRSWSTALTAIEERWHEREMNIDDALTAARPRRP